MKTPSFVVTEDHQELRLVDENGNYLATLSYKTAVGDLFIGLELRGVHKNIINYSDLHRNGKLETFARQFETQVLGGMYVEE